ncbi:MAG: hypothetical protein R6X19_10595 [Kiritimatiellia bacterium]
MAGDLLRGLAAILTVGLGVLLLLAVCDNLLRLPAGLRLAALVSLAAALGALFAHRLAAPLRRRRRHEAVAVELEKRFGINQNRLINAWQFEGADLPPNERPFGEEVAREARQALASIPRGDFWDTPRLMRALGLFAISLALALLYAAAFPRHAANGLLRALLPLADIPPAGRLLLTLQPGAAVEIDEGDALTLVVLAQTPAGEPAATPPVLRVQAGTQSVPADRAGDRPELQPLPGHPAGWFYSFPKADRSFAFRVFAADTWSKSVPVTVRPGPRLADSRFQLTPPPYTGLAAVTQPGPPAALAALPGSILTASVRVTPLVTELTWTGPDGARPFTPSRGTFQLSWTFTNAGPYSVTAPRNGPGPERVLARGRLALEADQPPTVEFDTAERNRFVNPGGTVQLPVKAGDDYGVREVRVAARLLGEKDDSPGLPLRTWRYLGPPGQKSPPPEVLELTLDPERFPPGGIWAVEAQADDFSPAGTTGRSAPLLLRIRAIRDVGANDGQPLSRALALLRETVAAQEKANTVAENLRLNLQDAIARQSLPAQSGALKDSQATAQNTGRKALDAFRAAKEEGAATAGRLDPLVNGEMENVRAGLARLGTLKAPELPPRLDDLRDRQDYILNSLIALLGRTADRAAEKPKATAAAGKEEPPPREARQMAQELREDLLDFIEAQKKILDKSRTLLDKAPQDLTAEEEKILGDLAREESRWATYFEEKLTDFSKLPLQDFADGSLANEYNETFMEMKKAAKSLYEKKIELAVPQEQSGLENAKELVQNLEKWLSDKPDNLKWLMEEPAEPGDIALAELPAELEDIVGELLDKEEEMTEAVEDVTSSWMDSPDKGAGWDAMDGPISSMAAKGVTGNLLPNQMEVGGRSGEGRSGRSSGQMAESAAEGKGGRETPTRLSPSPFEAGSVDDSSKESPGGATGGGKLSGFAGEGLRGPVPPPLQQKMARLAGQQAQIRQAAEALALRLRAWNVPGAELETAVVHMRELEDSASKGYGPGVRQAFHETLDTLEAARRTAGGPGAVRREQSALPERLRQEIGSGLQDGIPAGYEEMAGAYFRQLAEPGK